MFSLGRLLFLCALLASACGRFGFVDGSDRTLDAGLVELDAARFMGSDTALLTGPDAIGPQPEMVTVQPTYPSRTTWNHYIKNDDPGQGEHHQDDVPCTGSETSSYYACVHAGQRLRVAVPGQTSCDGLVARDNLGAFLWTCSDLVGSVEVFSTGLAADRGLGDLIDGINEVWRDNHIIVEKNQTIVAQSSPAVWWSNSLVRLDLVVDPIPATKPIELDAADTIYYLPASFETTTGYVITSDRVSVVVLPGATLSYSASGDDVSQCDNRGVISSSALCLVFGNNRRLLWLEGTFAGDALGRVEDIIVLGGSSFAAFHNMDVSGANDNGISLRTVSHSLLSDVTVHDNAGVGLSLNWNSLGTTLQRVVAERNGGDGINVNNSRGGFLRQVTAIDNGRDGIRLEATDGNQLRNLSAYHNQQTGVSLLGTDTAASIMSANNGATGIRTNGGDNTVLIEATAVNNATSGFQIQSNSRGNYIAAITTANNAIEGVRVNFSPMNTVTSLLSMNNRDGLSVRTQANQVQILGATLAFNSSFELITDSDDGHYEGVRLSTADDCSISGSGNNVELSTVCRQTDGTPLVVAAPTTSAVGKIATDTRNTTPLTGGTFQYDVVAIDWTQFEHPWRTIGLDGGPFPTVSQQGRCSQGTTCRIWDWSLRVSDTVVRNVSATPNGNNTAHHFWAAADATECAQRNGTWDQPAAGDCTTEFVLNTHELFDDGIGNDNGLCESNEACLFLSNHGSYQGTGAVVNGPAFVDGSITGVTLYSYSTNGSP